MNTHLNQPYLQNLSTQTVHRLSDTVIVGRHQDCNLVLKSEKGASRKHARITVQNESVVLMDLGSLNGTLVNGREINRPVQLSDGDIVIFDEQEYRFTNAASHYQSGSDNVTVIANKDEIGRPDRIKPAIRVVDTMPASSAHNADASALDETKSWDSLTGDFDGTEDQDTGQRGKPAADTQESPTHEPQVYVAKESQSPAQQANAQAHQAPEPNAQVQQANAQAHQAPEPNAQALQANAQAHQAPKPNAQAQQANAQAHQVQESIAEAQEVDVPSQQVSEPNAQAQNPDAQARQAPEPNEQVHKPDPQAHLAQKPEAQARQARKPNAQPREPRAAEPQFQQREQQQREQHARDQQQQHQKRENDAYDNEDYDAVDDFSAPRRAKNNPAGKRQSPIKRPPVPVAPRQSQRRPAQRSNSNDARDQRSPFSAGPRPGGDHLSTRPGLAKHYGPKPKPIKKFNWVRWLIVVPLITVIVLAAIYFAYNAGLSAGNSGGSNGFS